MLTYQYNEAVEYLLKKYGKARDDYFREQSYERFLKGEIKKLQKESFRDLPRG